MSSSAGTMVAQPDGRSLEHAANLPALVGRAVHVDIELAGLEGLHLRRIELGIGRHLVGIAVLDQLDDHGAVLARCGHVNMSHGSVYAVGADAAADAAV